MSIYIFVSLVNALRAKLRKKTKYQHKSLFFLQFPSENALFEGHREILASTLPKISFKTSLVGHSTPLPRREGPGEGRNCCHLSIADGWQHSILNNLIHCLLMVSAVFTDGRHPYSQFNFKLKNKFKYILLRCRKVKESIAKPHFIPSG